MIISTLYIVNRNRSTRSTKPKTESAKIEEFLEKYENIEFKIPILLIWFLVIVIPMCIIVWIEPIREILSYF